LDERHTARLLHKLKRPSVTKAAALALAAVRETYEETGLMLGTHSANPIAAPAGPWEAFARAHVIPDLGAIHFVARAITPTNRPRRFDSRFFAAEIGAVVHRAEGFVGPEAELVELAADHHDRARRPAEPHRYRHEPRPSGAVLPDGAPTAGAGNPVTSAMQRESERARPRALS
jgi:8-oxo-dGTP pyrophosphatase MutT (NUDIX family)